MEITRIGGGIEYRPEYLSLVLPGDRDYRVRTVQASNVVAVQKNGTISPSAGDTAISVTGILSGGENKAANDRSLAFLRYLGDLETNGIYRNLAGIETWDEYAGGHRGIIDLWV